MDGKGKVGFGKFCHQKSGVCEWMAREKKDSENFAIRKVEFVIGWQGKVGFWKILPSENEICELDGKKPGEPRKMLPSENEICELDGKKPGEPRKMLPSEKWSL